MDILTFGERSADIVLLQPVDERDLRSPEKELELIRESTGKELLLAAFPIQDWNDELSPWEAPAVFGRQGFGKGAETTLKEVIRFCDDRTKTYYLGGYSLAGLFALWSAYQTDLFEGIAAASPSVWFPGFNEYMKERQIRTGKVYLSLGDKEEHVRNPVMATVGERIRTVHALLKGSGVECALEWNEGNHFANVPSRMAKAFSRIIEMPA